MLIIKMMTLTTIMTTINAQLSKFVTIFSYFNQDRSPHNDDDDFHGDGQDRLIIVMRTRALTIFMP